MGSPSATVWKKMTIGKSNEEVRETLGRDMEFQCYANNKGNKDGQ